MTIVRIIFNLLRFDRANWKAVTLCIMGAVVFWVFTAFNKNYSTNVSFPLVFEFDGEKYAPAELLPKTVNMNVSGNGWDLFRKHLGLKVPPLSISLDHPNEVKKIVGSTLPPMLATQVGNLKINYVVTDTLHLQIDARTVHHYKLIADISSVTFRQGYGRISPVVVLPDSVLIDGPESTLQALADSLLLTVARENVSENFREEVEINFTGSEYANRNPPVAQVIFEVGQVKEVNKKMKVVTDKGVNVTALDSVEAWFQIPVSQLEDFNLQAREIYLKMDAAPRRENNSVLTKILNLPPYAQLLRIDSARTTRN